MEEQLLTEVGALCRDRSIDRIVVGLPLLPSGDEGEQAAYVRAVARGLSGLCSVIEFRDERYTTPAKRSGKHMVDSRLYDGDAAAACALLQ